MASARPGQVAGCSRYDPGPQTSYVKLRYVNMYIVSARRPFSHVPPSLFHTQRHVTDTEAVLGAPTHEDLAHHLLHVHVCKRPVAA